MHLTAKDARSDRKTEYRALHYWVAQQLGTPKLCQKCKRTDAPIYDWANISGTYLKDIKDWKRLCRRCHISQDLKKDYCKLGHEIAGDNLYVKPSGHRECRTCRIEYKRKYRLKNPKKVNVDRYKPCDFCAVYKTTTRQIGSSSIGIPVMSCTKCNPLGSLTKVDDERR